MATVVDQKVTFRLASPEPSGLFVPSTLLELYQPRIGPVAVSLWLNLRWMARQGRGLPSDDWIPSLCNEMRTMPMQLLEAMDALLVHELLRVEDGHAYVVQEPLNDRAFFERFGDAETADEKVADEAPAVGAAGDGTSADGSAVDGKAAGRAVTDRAVVPDDSNAVAAVDETAVAAEAGPVRSGEAPGASRVARRIVWDRRGSDPVEAPAGGKAREERGAGMPPGDRSPDGSAQGSSGPLEPETQNAREADLSAVMGMYHKKIGMIGPTQFEKLRWWVDEQSMSAEVIALAIEETANNAEMPTIQYLESVLRNWHNAGVRKFEDVLKRKGLSRSLRRGSLAPLGDGESGAPSEAGGRPRERAAKFEGMANASAYEEADPERLRRWKELYADEQ